MYVFSCHVFGVQLRAKIRVSSNIDVENAGFQTQSCFSYLFYIFAVWHQNIIAKEQFYYFYIWIWNNHGKISPVSEKYTRYTNYDAYRVLIWQWFTTFNFAYLQVIFNHIDHVSHYFRKIWPLYADDIISIL